MKFFKNQEKESEPINTTTNETKIRVGNKTEETKKTEELLNQFQNEYSEIIKDEQIGNLTNWQIESLKIKILLAIYCEIKKR